MAVSVLANGARDLWVYPLAGGRTRRLTNNYYVNRLPIWTPDGLRILFSSDRAGPRPPFMQDTWYGNVYSVPADGSSPPERLLLGPGPSDIHPRVLQAIGRNTVGHLDPYYLQLMDDLQEMARARWEGVKRGPRSLEAIFK